MFQLKYSKLSGFTLIELLVVISIIGLLATIVLVSVNNARKKARNVVRAADLKQISLALEMYYDTNGNYPNTGSTWRSECNAWGGYAAANVIPGLVPTYMSAFPTDPSMNKSGSTCCYLYRSNAADYALLAHNCSDTIFSSQPSLLDPTRDGGSNACVVDGTNYRAWKLSSSGGRCW